ncbi:toxin-antitoxin system YwqK family antitoxin [Sinomicrobium weinanense]|uniref:Antitoxin component YwqK of the YwqJK toxin-antitoxin module n=1 Tax=Sinomicrobium weinanense TaxID=2842200 RepID=A0A926Q415_9FLAO|nr:hypothetical protein [Sinomicrobium weinanense]MBC9797499.1 hypothetical protein [Sinomicrobium weinanense]MBU3122215.1 hypothetical protein [Sinomicrobium weinanense]
MRTPFITVLLLICFAFSNAQNDTIWFDGNWKKTTKEKAFFYRLPVKKEKKLYRINDFYIDGTRQMTGLSRYRDSVHLEGKAVWYDEKGEAINEQTYKDNILHGVSTFYRPWGSYGTRQEITYQNGKKKKEVFFDTDRNGIRFENYLEKERIVKSVFYGDEGELIGSFNAQEQEGEKVSYYSNPMKVKTVVEIRDGSYKYSYSFFPNGQARSTFDTIQLKKTFYNEQGGRIGELQYESKQNGLFYLEGELYEYNTDGRTIGRIIGYENGRQTSVKEFNNNGILKREDILENGRVVKTISYTDKGEELGVFTKKDDILNGTIREKNNDIITYKDNKAVQAVKHYHRSDKVFASLENSVITFYDSIGKSLGRLRVALQPGKYFPDLLENGSYNPAPVEGTLFRIDYQNRIALKARYKNSKKTEETTYNYRREIGSDEIKGFGETKAYNENEQLIKRITYYSNGRKQSEINYKPDSESTKTTGIFFDQAGKQTGEYNYETQTGVLYEFFSQSDDVEKIIQRENGEYVKQKTYQQVYNGVLRTYDIVLREDIEANGKAKFYARQGQLIAEATFINGKPTGTIYDFRSKEKMELKEGMRHGAYIKYESDETNVKEEGYYINDKKHGKFIEFVDGTKRVEENFNAGEKEGYTIYYDKKGEEASRLLYKNGAPYEGRQTSRYGDEKIYEKGTVVKEIKNKENLKTVTNYLSEQKSSTTVYDAKGNSLLSYEKADNRLHGKVVRFKNNKAEHTAIFSKGTLTTGTVWIKTDNGYRSEAYSQVNKDNNKTSIKTYNKEGELLFSGEINPALYTDYSERILDHKLGIKTYISDRDLFIEELGD